MEFEVEEWIKKIRSLKDLPRFIAFEGGEGAGKTTQAKLLASFLRKCGIRARTVRDPGTTPLGERVRKILKSDISIDPVSELFLFLAARRQLVVDVIRVFIRKGFVVIADRFTASTLAYQGGGRGLMPETLPLLCHIATGGVEPEVVFVLDIDPERGLMRKKKGEPPEVWDRLEKENLDFHRRVRDFYIGLHRTSRNVFIVDASQDVYSVFQDVLTKLYDFSKEMQSGS